MSFVHLHTHSEYSLLMSSCRIKSMAKQAQEWGMPALALTDYGNMFGAIQHYFACKDAGINPILGLEVYIAPEGRHIKGAEMTSKQPNLKLVLLAQNLNGYQNLCQISSRGFLEGFYYVPRVDYELLREHSQDLICLTGSKLGVVPWTFNNKSKEDALSAVQDLKGIYSDRLYLETNRTGLKEWDEVNPFLEEVSQISNVPIVAANDVHYFKQGDQIAQEVLVCIGTNKTLQDESRFRLGSNEFYFKSPEEMRRLFSDKPEYCDRTLEVAERCRLEFELKDDQGKPIYHLPTFPTQEGASLKDETRRLVFEGLDHRIEEFESVGKILSEEQVQQYKDRLDYELGVIDNMGFSGYFLIVQDFINWSKDHGIPVGPGRGSGAGSLVAYCLKITDLDPMPYNLIFERFLNPERVSMPDFDIDFCQEGRQDVISYVSEKYGENSVSQIITYGKLQARAAIRDVGRVMGMTYADVDRVSKLMPDVLGISIDEAIKTEPRIRELMEQDSKVQTLMDLARKIEGLTRHAGIHAAGVVIADGDISKISPLSRGAAGERVVQFDMKHAEKVGLIKFDFLGLKTLTHINEALRLIKVNQDKDVATTDISLEDSGIYETISSGDTNGVFQFEGDGITDMCIKAKPDCFEDIIAMNALYRPGPMAMIPDYLDRKHGKKKVEYLFDELEPILKETYGIVVYQEHVQLIASKIASYSLGEADILRRAMGKKIAEEMEKQKKRFMEGAEKNGYDKVKAEKLFDTMAEFAKYGFNKSHAAAYCVISAQTAWLKHYYPVEFYAALLSTEMSDTDKVVKYVKDAQKHNIEVHPPHINHSDYKFSVEDRSIFFSLGAIKGVGQSAVESIIETRESLENKKFESIEQFFEKVDLRKVNKKTVECLIKAGAFDGFGANRAELLQGYSKFIDRAEQIKRDREVGQVSLFSIDQEVQDEEKVVLEKCEPWPRSLALEHEKSVLGFYLSDHPLAGIEHLTKIWTTGSVENLVKKENKAKVQVVGLVSSLREVITKKGTRMCFGQLEDLSGTVELIVFPDVYSESELILKGEGVIIVSGTVEVTEEKESAKILVEDVMALNDQLVKSRKLIFTLTETDAEKVDLIKKVIDKYPGKTTTSFNVQLSDINKSVAMELGGERGVNPVSDFFESIQTEFGTADFVTLLR